ncbi:exodeoxyribonuclease VII small subunit [Alicyclobacillus fastidiosus]|uniref:Exodeoxyribonuclease 7 small subunit n=1 Tax=Alicyclobacillus fastidiosus TaxID=392011 RepID=A0ABV5AFY9_9BACL|nr:exodeoxyribonuclease VII small subunit [Alicyclobacillus fastidiosus]WEH11722.1 exodeoxyribonuclease VII small subunit [Alicyclobacillus fastidiosus]
MESKPDLTFEEAMKKLEDIVRQLESGSLPLAESLDRYQESMHLVKFCREQLDKAEFKLEQLSMDEVEAVPDAEDGSPTE